MNKMVYVGKDCKKFIDRVIKLFNCLIRYNIEPIVLLQIAKTFNSFEPIILYKPIKQNIFDFIHSVYINDEIYKELTRELSKNPLIKTKKDISTVSPIIFGSFNHLNLVENSDCTIFSESYFIVVDLFKDFVKKHEIGQITTDLEFYDNFNCMYDTSYFIYKNKVDKNFENEAIKAMNPIKYFPMSNNYDSKSDYCPKIQKDMLFRLNMSHIYIPSSDNGVKMVEYSNKEEISVILDEIDNNGYYIVEKLNNTKIYADFIHFKPDNILITYELETKEYLNMVINNVGMKLKSKDFILYVFYKYFLV
jgi:hypothetical protein